MSVGSWLVFKDKIVCLTCALEQKVSSKLIKEVTCKHDFNL